MENKKELREFLMDLISLTEANIRFLDGTYIHKVMPFKYENELKIIQNTINNFEFID